MPLLAREIDGVLRRLRMEVRPGDRDLPPRPLMRHLGSVDAEPEHFLRC